MDSFIQSKRTAILKFVKNRENKHGGYGLVKIIPPDLEDTYYALQIKHLLGDKIVSPKTRKYLVALSQANGLHSWRLAYYLVSLLKLYKLEIPGHCIPKHKPHSYSEFYYQAVLYKLMRKPLVLDAKTDSALRRQTPQGLKYLSEISKYILLMKLLGLPIHAAKFRDWILGLQCADGGFTSIHKTAPAFMEETYDGLLTLDALGAKPRNLPKCREFLESSFVIKEGGFGRQFNTVPTLQFTYNAVVGLNILSRVE